MNHPMSAFARAKPDVLPYTHSSGQDGLEDPPLRCGQFLASRTHVSPNHSSSTSSNFPFVAISVRALELYVVAGEEDNGTDGRDRQGVLSSMLPWAEALSILRANLFRSDGPNNEQE